MPAQVMSWIGQKLGTSPYRVVRGLSAGGMALVFLAEDMHDGTRVVIKCPRPDAGDPFLAARFADEIRAMASLRHPNIMPLLGHGDHEGIPFLVLPFLQGGSLLEQWRKQAPSQDPSSLARWLPQIAHALDFLHGHGWLHRDVKPANILFDGYQTPFLADLGLTKTYADPGRPGLTRLGAPAPGTPRYMAPEMLTADPADGRADQFSLAVMLYEGLTGQSPYPGESPQAVLRNQALGNPVPVHRAQPGLPDKLSIVLGRGIALKREHRYASCGEFAREVLAALPPGGATMSQVPAGHTWSIPEALVPHLPEAPRPVATATPLPPAYSPTPADHGPPLSVPVVVSPGFAGYPPPTAPAQGPGGFGRLVRALFWMCLGLFVGGLVLPGSPLHQSAADPFADFMEREIGWKVPWARFREAQTAPEDLTGRLKTVTDLLEREKKSAEADRAGAADELDSIIGLLEDSEKERDRLSSRAEALENQIADLLAKGKVEPEELKKLRKDLKTTLGDLKTARADLKAAQAAKMEAETKKRLAEEEAATARVNLETERKAREELVDKAVKVHDEVKLYVLIRNKTGARVRFDIQTQAWDNTVSGFAPHELGPAESLAFNKIGAIWAWGRIKKEDGGNGESTNLLAQLFYAKDAEPPTDRTIDVIYDIVRVDGELRLRRLLR